MSNAKLFVNYRRRDAPGSAGRLHDDLARQFGHKQVFRDVSMTPGVDFVAEITKAAGTCHALLAVIGPRWVGMTDEHGSRRLDDPDDYVRLEIETALARDDVTLIPVLVEDATMPSRAELPPSLAELARLNACHLRDSSWEHDLGRLVSVLTSVMRATPPPPPRRKKPPVREDEPHAEPDPVGWGTAARASALALLAGPLALALSVGLRDKPAPGGANTQDDLNLARERIVYYALERALIWAVIGATVIFAWTLFARTGRHAVSSWLAGAAAGALGGLAGGALYQCVKYLANDARENPIHLPDGVLLRGVSYAIPAALIGWAYAGPAGSMQRREGLAAGAVAGLIAAAITNAQIAPGRVLSLALEAGIVAATLGAAAVVVARTRHATEPAERFEARETALAR
jgi:hypothetical protein